VLRLTPRDCTSGFRAYRSDVLATIDPASTTAEGYAFLTELVRRMTRHGYSVAETPIVFRDRIKGKSKMSGRIIIESMLLVTRWAAVDIFKRSARR
jgi:dolichol-phosphate mannosyltransferase